MRFWFCATFLLCAATSQTILWSTSDYRYLLLLVPPLNPHWLDAAFSSQWQDWRVALDSGTLDVVVYDDAIASPDSLLNSKATWWYLFPESFLRLGPAAYPPLHPPLAPLPPNGSDRRAAATNPTCNLSSLVPLTSFTASRSIISTRCGSKLGLFGAVTPGRVVRTATCLNFLPSSKWFLISKRNSGYLKLRPASEQDLVGALWHIAGLQLRGKYYRGEERTRLSQVSLQLLPGSRTTAGGEIFGCCRNGTSRLCSRAAGESVCKGEGGNGQAATGNVDRRDWDDGRWPKEGAVSCPTVSSWQPRISSFWPRRGRAGGGGTLTVYGENFGLYGSRPLIRVGQEEAKCGYPLSQWTAGSAPSDPMLLPSHCRDGLLNGGEDKVDCGGADCQPCQLMQLNEHCSDGVQNFDETKVDEGGRDCLPEHCFTAAVGDETGNNCGGSCQPCNPARQDVSPQTSVLLCSIPPGTMAREPLQVAIPQGEVGHVMHTSCASYLSAGDLLQYGSVEMKWSSFLKPLTDTSQLQASSLAVDTVTGAIFVSGSLLGSMATGTTRGVSSFQLGEVREAAGGRSCSAALLPGVVGSFLARFEASGSCSWLTTAEPFTCVFSGDCTDGRLQDGGSLSLDDLVLYSTPSGRRRLILSGVFAKSPAILYNVDPVTGLSMKQSTAPSCPSPVYRVADPNSRPSCSSMRIDRSFPSSSGFIAVFTDTGILELLVQGVASSSSSSAALPSPLMLTLSPANVMQPPPPLVSSFPQGTVGSLLYFAGTLSVRASSTLVNISFPQLNFQSSQSFAAAVASLLPSSDSSVGFVGKAFFTESSFLLLWVRFLSDLGAQSGVNRVKSFSASSSFLVLSATFGPPPSSSVKTVSVESCQGGIPGMSVFCAGGGGGGGGGGQLLSFSLAESFTYDGPAGGYNSLVICFNEDGSIAWSKRLSQMIVISSSSIFEGVRFLRNRPEFTSDASSVPFYAPSMEEAVRRYGEEAIDFTAVTFVVVAGTLGSSGSSEQSSVSADFGVTRQPLGCSRRFKVGEQGGAPASEPCSGFLRPQGTGSDSFLVKYEVSSGLPEWVKLVGSANQREEVTTVKVKEEDGSIVAAGTMVTPFLSFSPGVALDVFGMVRSGRPNAAGCNAVYGNAAIMKADTARSSTAFDLSLSAIKTASSGRSGSQQSTGAGATGALLGRARRRANFQDQWEVLGCSADGLVWARTIATGKNIMSLQESSVPVLSTSKDDIC
ncbi:hypothetical protein GUITHDRAFT_137092 [Guillardia theta CCMP2712]|uniref:IPT/TIG domain-containing protein n=1 Tax=Guillardia theta (strain CCMP2712) TaxID=905079 RepID=L1JI03_GUITC|nr:hypothetical protein GUITHDRAFT_137092 [Guillardia theta CCMP2712]EKX48158.1 hypothetical protein GUITHDRAFT_137092 [Guillardia theta CCMP2712]|eukprot:XP_005835138.1 hypothetical protein GUITHDRAFT_137092 [Guillardia theta CCMP2712]